MIKTIELAPIKESTEDYEKIEAAIIALFRKEFYLPIMKELSLKSTLIKNSKESLIAAIQSGRLTYSRGQFTGGFTSETSKEIKKLGAVWDRTQGSWKIPKSALPQEIKLAIDSSQLRFMEKIAGLDKKLAAISPEEIADKLQISKLFDTALWKVQRDFVSTVKGITVAPKLTEAMSKKITDDYQNNMRLYIKSFTEQQIKTLRADVRESTLNGLRYETLVKDIQKNYDVTLNKAKFLARQETSLMMTKFKQTRYEDAGVEEYIWKCVAGSKNHPVRPIHKSLENKKFRWDDPPITDSKGSRNNPGQDYNCRCFAKPVVRIKG